MTISVLVVDDEALLRTAFTSLIEAEESGGEGFAQSRACFAELEEWLSGAEAGGPTHAEPKGQLDERGWTGTTAGAARPRRAHG
jgi:hypothetical protein